MFQIFQIPIKSFLLVRVMIFLFICASIASGFCGKDSIEINFVNYSSFSNLIEKTQNSKKSGFVFFNAKWCVTCKRQKDIFSDFEVVKLFEGSFVNIEVDVDKLSKKDLLRNKVKLDFLPALLFVDLNGDVIAYYEELLDSQKLLAIGRRIKNIQEMNKLTSGIDKDEDQVDDIWDNCPNQFNPFQFDSDNDGKGDACEFCKDSDNDGVCDFSDNCIKMPNPNQRDTDKDGVGDLCDNCNLQPNQDQIDTDGDFIGDVCDEYPKNTADFKVIDKEYSLEYHKLSIPYMLEHGEKICDDHIACTKDIIHPSGFCTYTPICNLLKGEKCIPFNDLDFICVDSITHAQYELNRLNSKHPRAKDSDNDFIADHFDNCPDIFNPGQEDEDKDLVGDVCDNCVRTINTLQEDYNEDGIGDACQSGDKDNDGICDSSDYFPNDSTKFLKEHDLDTDGIASSIDNCPYTFNPSQIDNDNDGIGLSCDCNDNNPNILASRDSDNDGICDDQDKCDFQWGEIQNLGCPEKRNTLEIKLDSVPIISYESKIKLPDGSISEVSFNSFRSIQDEDVRFIFDSIISPIFYDFPSIQFNTTLLSYDSILVKSLDTILNSTDIIRNDILDTLKLKLNKVDIKKLKNDSIRQEIVWIQSSLEDIDSLIVSPKKAKQLILDWSGMLPRYVDSLRIYQYDSLKNMMFEEFVFDMIRDLKSLTNIEGNSYNAPAEFIDKMLISKYFDYLYLGRFDYNYLLPVCCYKSKNRKFLDNTLVPKYCKDALCYEKRYSYEFDFGSNPHYTFLTQGDYKTGYFLDDKLSTELYSFSTERDDLTSDIHLENPFRDPEVARTQILISSLRRKKASTSSTLEGVSELEERQIFNKITEINSRMDKYVLIEGYEFYAEDR